MKLIHMRDYSFTDTQWQAHYALLEALHERYQSAMAKVGCEQSRAMYRSLLDTVPDYHRFVVFDNEEAVGWAELKVCAPNTAEQSVHVRVESIYDDAPGELERIMAAEFLHLLTKHNSTTTHLMAPTPRISSIARHWLGTELNRLDRYRLNRADANTALMRSWLDRIPRENPKLRLEFFSPVPEEHLAAHTESIVTYAQDMPTERKSGTSFHLTVDEVRRDLEWRRNNDMYLYTYALFDAHGSMVGQTNAMIVGDDPSDAYQAVTGVNREYRGRGLSRWLKAALFFKVGADFPTNETMHTEMRAVNEPIQKINAEMGYRLVSSGHEFELTADNFRELLNG